MSACRAGRPPNWPAGDAGLYCLVLALASRLQTRVGRLGSKTIEPGTLLYVGRARRGLFARLARHMRRRKPRRWHVDYLFPPARPVGALVIDGEPVTECQLAARLATGTGTRRIIAGFGSSDCRCEGHLLWRPGVPTGIENNVLRQCLPADGFEGVRYFAASAWAVNRGGQIT